MNSIKPNLTRVVLMLAAAFALVFGAAVPAYAQAATPTLEVVAVDPSNNTVTIRGSGLTEGTQYAVVIVDEADFGVDDAEAWQVATFTPAAGETEWVHTITIPDQLADAGTIRIRYESMDEDAEDLNAFATFDPTTSMGESVADAVVVTTTPTAWTRTTGDTDTSGTGETTTGQTIPATGASERSARRFASAREMSSFHVSNRDYTQFDVREDGEPRVCGDEYIIAGGEWLGLVVINCNVPLDTLLAANPQITNPDLVYAGEKIRIPASDFGEILHPTTGSPFVSPLFPSGMTDNDREQ